MLYNLSISKLPAARFRANPSLIPDGFMLECHLGIEKISIKDLNDEELGHFVEFDEYTKEYNNFLDKQMEEREAKGLPMFTYSKSKKSQKSKKRKDRQTNSTSAGLVDPNSKNFKKCQFR